jgi:hypothetical protein
VSPATVAGELKVIEAEWAAVKPKSIKAATANKAEPCIREDELKHDFIIG